MKEEIMLRWFVVGLALFLVGTGFGYWWHFMSG